MGPETKQFNLMRPELARFDLDLAELPDFSRRLYSKRTCYLYYPNQFIDYSENKGKRRKERGGGTNARRITNRDRKSNQLCGSEELLTEQEVSDCMVSY